MPRSEQGRKNANAIKARYTKENTTQQSIKFNNKTDADILAWLEHIPNKQGYIKELIRKDIKRDTD